MTATTPRPRGPNVTAAFHRRARKLGLLPAPEREIPPHIAVIIAIGVAAIASILTWSLGG